LEEKKSYLLMIELREVRSSKRECRGSFEKMNSDENQIKEVFINEGRGHSPSHLKFFLLVFSKLKEGIK